MENHPQRLSTSVSPAEQPHIHNIKLRETTTPASTPQSHEFDVCNDLPKSQREQLLTLLHEFKDIFAFSVYDIKEARVPPVVLHTTNPHKIIKSRIFRFSPQDKIDAQAYFRSLRTS